MPTAAGIDVGASAVKVAIFKVVAEREEQLALLTQRLRRRDQETVIAETYHAALEMAKLAAADVDYVASTGEGELVSFRRGHFYSMTTHARGAIYLVPEARAVLDAGALHGRAILIDDRSKVLSYRMTSQCASGSGQFLENIARYLGVSLADVGPLSLAARDPEVPSSICAVLAETDVINMVSRGISTPNILQGIHASMATRFAKLLGAVKAEGVIAITGGLAADVGLVEATAVELRKAGSKATVKTHPDAIYAGAIGAALWGAFRHERLKRRSKPAPATAPSTRIAMDATHWLVDLRGAGADAARRMHDELDATPSGGGLYLVADGDPSALAGELTNLNGQLSSWRIVRQIPGSFEAVVAKA